MTTDTPHLDAEHVDALITGGLPPPERAAADAHVAACAACAAAVADARSADERLRSTFAAGHPRVDLEDTVVNSLRAARRLTITPPARRAIVAAAAAAVIVGLGAVGSARLDPTANSGRPKATATRSEPDYELCSAFFKSPRSPEAVRRTAVEDEIALNDFANKCDVNSRRPTATEYQISESHDFRSSGPETTVADSTGITHEHAVTGGELEASRGGSSSPAQHYQYGLKRQVAAANATGLNYFHGAVGTFDPGTLGSNATPTLTNTLGLNGDHAGAAASGGNPDAMDRHPTVEGLIQNARTLQDQGRYRDAMGVLDQIQRADPQNQYAQGVKQLIQDKANGLEQREYAARYNRELEKHLNASDEKDIPYSDILHYRDDWPVLAEVPAVASLAATRPAVDGRKVIRTGTMSFDVDRFDTAAATVAKLAGEAGGFVGTTDSQKLPNGKTAGTITLRVPPERLDLLVLSLRALGDLKAQQITAQDVTKEYTDLDAELTADRAMQDRLLDLIRTGKGSIKDLLAAETELGNWRVKIEKIEGQLRYYNAQVGLSTLAVSIAERDLHQAATTVETETADMGVEADDVERARDGALKAIDDGHGRVIEAELKRLDAGQLAARIVAEVPPESAGSTIDRLKQLGRVARLEVHRQQTATSDETTTAAVRTERRPTRITLSVYNLANVAPRRTTAVTLAASDPDAAYGALLSIADGGGRVVTSNLDRSGNATSTVSLEVPPGKLEAAMAVVRSQGEVLHRTATVNPDVQNTTDAKVGLTVSIVSLATVNPREQVAITVGAADVPAAYRAIATAAAAGHVRVSSLNEQDRQNVSATVEADVPRSALTDFDRTVAAAGDTVARSSGRSGDAENTVDSAVRVTVTLAAADRLPPRETTAVAVEVADVDRAAADAQAASIAAGGRVLAADVNRSASGPSTAKVTLDVPLGRAGEVVGQLRALGTVRAVDANRDATAPAGPLAHARVELTLTTADALVADNTGPTARLRHGLSVGLAGLLWTVQLIVVGLCLVGPWVAVAWLVRRVVRWRTRRTISA